MTANPNWEEIKRGLFPGQTTVTTLTWSQGFLN
jgi:hypothetical protein